MHESEREKRMRCKQLEANRNGVILIIVRAATAAGGGYLAGQLKRFVACFCLPPRFPLLMANLEAKGGTRDSAESKKVSVS